MHLSTRHIAALRENTVDSTPVLAYNAAKHLLEKLDKLSKMDDLDLEPFDIVISCINDMHNDNPLYKNPCKSMTDAIKSYLHIY